MELHFIPVKDNPTKMRKLCEVIAHHYRAGQKVLIAVENKEVGRYVDELLWRYPKDSFLPHQFALKPVSNKVVITSLKENLNKSSVLFNLCSQASPICSQFKLIYEFDDETDPEKKRLSEERKRSYNLTAS